MGLHLGHQSPDFLEGHKPTFPQRWQTMQLRANFCRFWIASSTASSGDPPSGDSHSFASLFVPQTFKHIRSCWGPVHVPANHVLSQPQIASHPHRVNWSQIGAIGFVVFIDGLFGAIHPYMKERCVRLPTFWTPAQFTPFLIVLFDGCRIALVGGIGRPLRSSIRKRGGWSRRPHSYLRPLH